MNIQLKTELCDRFGIRYPLILAGMAGDRQPLSWSPPYPTQAGLVRWVRLTWSRTPFAIASRKSASGRISLCRQPFASRTSDRQERIEDVQQELNRMRGDLGIPHAGSDRVTTPDWFEQQFAVLLERRCPLSARHSAFRMSPYAASERS